MKSIRFIFALLFCFGVVGCSTPTTKNSLTRAKLKGNVRSVETTTWFAIEQDGEICKADTSSIDLLEFNPLGGITMRKNEYRYSIYKYDQNNNIIESCSYNSDDGLLTDKHTYKYDQNNNKTEWGIYSSDGLLFRNEIYKYDKNNNKIEKCEYNSKGLLYNKTTSKYDVNNNQIEWCMLLPGILPTSYA